MHFHIRPGKKQVYCPARFLIHSLLFRGKGENRENLRRFHVYHARRRVAMVSFVQLYFVCSALPVWRFTRQKCQIWRVFMLFRRSKTAVPAKRLFGGFGGDIQWHTCKKT